MSRTSGSIINRWKREETILAVEVIWTQRCEESSSSDGSIRIDRLVTGKIDSGALGGWDGL